MKKLLRVSMLAILLVVGASSMAKAQVCPLSGCFGACGGTSFSGSFTAPQDQLYLVDLENGLCASLGLITIVTVGSNAPDVRIGNGDFKFEAAKGDLVTVYCTNWATDPNILCFWAGQATIDVCEL
jgi:hypothetical protein